MKYYKILTILLFGLTISFYSCKDKETSKPSQQQNHQPQKLFDAAAQNSSSAWHYTCNKGCAGGAPAAGNCSTCGNTLVHNQAFHNNANNTTPATTTNPTTNPTNATNTPKPEPSQNAAGVWHYTCGNGCSGGAGSATKCGTCGNTLAHNTAYH